MGTLLGIPKYVLRKIIIPPRLARTKIPIMLHKRICFVSPIFLASPALVVNISLTIPQPKTRSADEIRILITIVRRARKLVRTVFTGAGFGA